MVIVPRRFWVIIPWEDTEGLRHATKYSFQLPINGRQIMDSICNSLEAAYIPFEKEQIKRFILYSLNMQR